MRGTHFTSYILHTLVASCISGVTIASGIDGLQSLQSLNSIPEQLNPSMLQASSYAEAGRPQDNFSVSALCQGLP